MGIVLLVSGPVDDARARGIKAVLQQAFAKGVGRLDVSLRLEGARFVIVDARAEWSESVHVDYRRNVWTALELAGISVAARQLSRASGARIIT